MPASPALAFGELVQAWAVWLERNAGRSSATVAKYRQYLDRLAAWCTLPPEEPKHRASTSDPLQLSAADLETFAGAHAHAVGLTPRARRPLVSALRGFYAWAKERGHVAGNPAETLPSPKVGRSLPLAASLSHVERLLMAPNVGTASGLRDAAMIATLAGCAPRVSGLVGLNESDLLWIPDGPRESLYLRLREKGDNVREVPAPHEVAILLRAYLAHPEVQAIDRTTEAGERVLFVSFRSRRVPAHEYHGERRRMTQRGVRRMLERHADRVGVPKKYAHPHALRHLYGAELAEDDADVLLRQALLGHADPKSAAIYSHLARRKLRQVVERSNPLRKMRAPLLDTLRAIDASATPSRTT